MGRSRRPPPGARDLGRRDAPPSRSARRDHARPDARRAPRGLERRRRARLADLTTWTANRNARRVPAFVIQATGGLDTKKKIVAKFGEGATFEKNKPLPPTVTVPKAALAGAAKRSGGKATQPT